MIANPHVPLSRLVLSLSEAMDRVGPEVSDHQQRVAYISINLARRMEFGRAEMLDVFLAAAFHDIGLIGVENKLKAPHLNRSRDFDWHAKLGCDLLKNLPVFKQASELIRYHHRSWDFGRGAESEGRVVPLASHILALADTVERMVNRNVPILRQSQSIMQRVVSLSDKQLHPDCVKVFCEAAETEAFWLDLTSSRIYGALLEQMDWLNQTVDDADIGPIAKVFARIVDATSRWTALHSAGVAATAVVLAEKLGLPPRQQKLLRSAGYFHDLGKLSVPGRILDKPDKLTDSEYSVIKGHAYHTFRILSTIGGLPQLCEWAALHHERLDGSGYPFHLDSRNLPLGSRIMAAADVVSAMSEDRPYRKGMDLNRSIGIIEKLVESGALDGDVVSILKRHRKDVDAVCRSEKAEYSRLQREIMRTAAVDKMVASA